MSGFLIGALALVLVTLAFLILPLWRMGRRPTGADFSRLQLNTAIYRDQLVELEHDRKQGSLSQADFDQASAELQRRMLEDTADEQAGGDNKPAAPASRTLPLVLGTFLLIGSILGYMAIGNPQAINPPHQQRFSEDEIERMVAGLAAKLEKEPENYQGWSMLARSYKAMGRFPDAARAYERTGPMLDTSAELLVDYADTLAASANGFTPKVLELIDKALKLEPANMQGLWLRGTAAFESKQYDKAITDWEALLKVLPPETEEAAVIKANIAEARDQQGKTGKAKVGADRTASTAAPAASAKQAISGRVEVAANLAGKVPAGATLMVVARPADGSRMPVGVFMAKTGLPATFTLDDSLSMSPDNPLSKHPELLVEPRISQSGQAMPQAGDLFGPAQKIKLGTAKVVLTINQIRP